MEPDPLLSGLHITDMCAHFSHSPQWGLEGVVYTHSPYLPASHLFPNPLLPAPSRAPRLPRRGVDRNIIRQSSLRLTAGFQKAEPLHPGLSTCPPSPSCVRGTSAGHAHMGPPPWERLTLIEVACSLCGSPHPFPSNPMGRGHPSHLLFSI